MIAITKIGAYEMLDVIQPCLAMSAGNRTYVEKLPIRYVCRRIAAFQTDCPLLETMNWHKHKIIDVNYETLPVACVKNIDDIYCILTNKYELKEFIKKMMK